MNERKMKKKATKNYLTEVISAICFREEIVDTDILLPDDHSLSACFHFVTGRDKNGHTTCHLRLLTLQKTSFVSLV